MRAVLLLGCSAAALAPQTAPPRRGVAAGLVLAFARALGEFGATLMFAGNIPGRTNTMPLELYAAYQSGDDERALFYVIVMVAVSVIVVYASSRLTARESGR